MAILSNINGKFAVESTGAIQFSGQNGSAGYVLKSNGNAAPTWVAPSTVIGGPYLPLSGGTLTGATATATGISFTIGGNLFVTGTSTLTGASTIGQTLSVTGLSTLIGGGNFGNSVSIVAGHGNTLLSLQYPGFSGANQASLDAWASEPGVTYNGSGIGANILNSPYYGRRVTNYGQTYLRFINGQAEIYTGAAASGTASTAVRRFYVETNGNATFTQNVTGGAFFATQASGGKGYSFNASGSGAGVANMFCPSSYTLAFGTNNIERMRITDYGSLAVGNTQGANANWGKIQCGGTITVGNSSGTYIAHGRISGDSDGMKLQGTSTGTYGNPSGITVDGYSIGINTNSPDIGNGTGDLVIRSWATVSRLAFWNSTSGEVSNRGQRISFQNANCIFENLESGYYAFKTAGSERFRIKSDGNVGIGDTNPASKLVVAGRVQANSGSEPWAFVSNPTSGSYGGFLMQYGNNTKGVCYYNSNSIIVGSEAAAIPLRFTTNGLYVAHFSGTTGNFHVGGITDQSEKLYVTGGTALAGANNTDAGSIKMYGDRKYPQANRFVKRNYSLAAGASGALYSLVRQWHDHVNWGLGNVNVIMWGIYYGKSNFNKSDWSCRYGYSGGAADVVANFNPGGMPQPTWTAATQASGNIHYRDLQIQIPAYQQISFEIISPGLEQTYNVNNTAGNTVYLWPH